MTQRYVNICAVIGSMEMLSVYYPVSTIDDVVITVGLHVPQHSIHRQFGRRDIGLSTRARTQFCDDWEPRNHLASFLRRQCCASCKAAVRNRNRPCSRVQMRSSTVFVVAAFAACGRASVRCEQLRRSGDGCLRAPAEMEIFCCVACPSHIPARLCQNYTTRLCGFRMAESARPGLREAMTRLREKEIWTKWVNELLISSCCVGLQCGMWETR